MTQEQLNDLQFYCWQLKIDSIEQLKQFNAKTPSDLIDKMSNAFNKGGD